MLQKQNKTQATGQSVTAFLNNIKDPQVRADCLALSDLMQQVPGCDPVMWGRAIVGFGSRH